MPITPPRSSGEPTPGIRHNALWISLLCACLLFENLFAAESSAPQGLLFELRGPGTSAPSYLFGTIHSEDPRVIALPTSTQAAFDACPGFALEVIPDGPALIKAMIAMTYTDGRLLAQILPPDLYEDTKKALAELGMNEEAFKDFKPWAIMTQLSTPPAKTGAFLDMVLYRSAVAGHKHIRGLETMDEQLAIFDALALPDQIALLRETLASRAHLAVMFDHLTQAYLRGDLVELARLSETYLREHDPRLANLLRENVIAERNRRMAERMVPLLNEGGWFIAIGALHLAGDAGVVSLLRDRGYALAPVD